MAQTGKGSVDYVEKRRTNACSMDYTLPLVVSNTNATPSPCFGKWYEGAEIQHRLPNVL